MYPENLKYSKEHLWVLVESGNARIGITDYAQQQLGDIVLIELPAKGTETKQGKSFGVVESVKSVSDLISPLSGEVLEINTGVTEDPGLANKDPHNKGWMITVRMSEASELASLLDAQGYAGTLKKKTK